MKRKPVDVGAAKSTPSIPIPPPGLLARAKKMGAVSAGPANISLDFLSESSFEVAKPKRKAARKRSTRGKG